MAKATIAPRETRRTPALPPEHVLDQLRTGQPLDLDALRAWHEQAEPWLRGLSADLAAKLAGLPHPSEWVLPLITISD